MELTKLKYFVYFIVILQLTLKVVSSPLELQESKNIREKRWARSSKSLHWPNGIVHYKIVCTEFTEDEVERIRIALQEIMNKTCIKFIEIDDKSDVKDFIGVECQVGGSCNAKLGYAGGQQYLNLERLVTINPVQACLSNRKIQHEFMHALGFRHEHNTPVRDRHINVISENIEEGRESYFVLDSEKHYEPFGCEFDYNSVMMPPTNKHAKKGVPSFVPLDPRFTPETIGIALSVSDCDMKRVNNMYCGGGNKTEAEKEVS